MQAYRLITDDDTGVFCQRVTEALNAGWSLHGSPAYAFDAANGVMRCAQAVVKEVDGVAYTPGMALRDL